MMKTIVFISILSVLAFSCSNSHKSVNPDNIYSHIIDYCETHPIDSSQVFTGEEEYIPYCYLGLNGKTLNEVISLFGTPISSVNPTYIYTNIPTDSYQWEDLGKILQKCGDKVPVYYAEWRPRKNKDIFLMLYFVKDGNNFRAIYGEQLNRLKYMDE